MDPNVNRGESQECLETCGDALPADDQATGLLLQPGKGPLGLEPWHHLCDGPTTIFLVYQTRFGICARLPRFRSFSRNAFAS